MPRQNPPDSHPARLSLISRHLAPVYPINTPYTVERLPNTIATSLLPQTQTRNMSLQPAHATLLIPGPIEFDDAVLQSMSHFSESHVSAGFVATFGETLSMLRKLFQTSDPSAQPFVLSGSGTLGWDIVAANLIEPGEDVLVLGTGYFSDGFADCLRVYGASVTELKAPVGTKPQLPDIEKALAEKKYKAITVTHVDTSTGVLSELQQLSALVHKVSPDTLIFVDGVCSVACEEIDFDAWGLDGVVTASQKAIGCPAGLSISMFSARAMKAFQDRKTPPTAYFASMKNWTPSASYLPSQQTLSLNLHTPLTPKQQSCKTTKPRSPRTLRRPPRSSSTPCTRRWARSWPSPWPSASPRTRPGPTRSRRPSPTWA
jgi:alanine-glyoxylate transaminase/serine-glyoxylate transaminase/serine-pyruvate transaminase